MAESRVAGGRGGRPRARGVDVARRAVRGAEERSPAAGGRRGQGAEGRLPAAVRAECAARAEVDDVRLAVGAMLPAMDRLAAVTAAVEAVFDAEGGVEGAAAAAPADAEQGALCAGAGCVAIAAAAAEERCPCEFPRVRYSVRSAALRELSRRQTVEDKVTPASMAIPDTRFGCR